MSNCQYGLARHLARILFILSSSNTQIKARREMARPAFSRRVADICVSSRVQVSVLFKIMYFVPRATENYLNKKDII